MKHLLKMNPSNQQLGHKNQDQYRKTAMTPNLLQEDQWDLSHSEKEPATAKCPLFEHRLVHHSLSQYHEAY